MELSGEKEAHRRLRNLCFLPALSHSGKADSGVKVRASRRPLIVSGGYAPELPRLVFGVNAIRAFTARPRDRSTGRHSWRWCPCNSSCRLGRQCCFGWWRRPVAPPDWCCFGDNTSACSRFPKSQPTPPDYWLLAGSQHLQNRQGVGGIQAGDPILVNVHSGAVQVGVIRRAVGGQAILLEPGIGNDAQVGV